MDGCQQSCILENAALLAGAEGKNDNEDKNGNGVEQNIQRSFPIQG